MPIAQLNRPRVGSAFLASQGICQVAASSVHYFALFLFDNLEKPSEECALEQRKRNILQG